MNLQTFLTATAWMLTATPLGQYGTQRTGAGEFLHEIRKRADRFDLVVNIYNREGDGQRFPDKFPTYAAAYEALIRFRPGSRLCSRPYLSSESA